MVLVAQRCTAVTVKFEDEAVADFFDAQVDAGRRPEEFGRVWIHTHPGSSAQPSQTDEATFARVFGGTDWAVMCILARGSQVYARLRYHVGPGADLLLPVDVDYTRPFAGTDEALWQLEYDRCVRLEPRDEPKPAEVPADAGRATRRRLAVDAWYEYTDYDRTQEAAYDYDDSERDRFVRQQDLVPAERLEELARDRDRRRRDRPAGRAAARGDRRPPAAAGGL